MNDYNSPGIKRRTIKIAGQEFPIEYITPGQGNVFPQKVTHYITSGDVVSLAGEVFIPGQYVLTDFPTSVNLTNIRGLATASSAIIEFILEKHTTPVLFTPQESKTYTGKTAELSNLNFTYNTQEFNRFTQITNLLPPLEKKFFDGIRRNNAELFCKDIASFLVEKIDLVNSAINTIFKGDRGNDRLIGDTNNNLLIGEQGNDTLIGNAGNDILVGGAGRDKLRGGTGADRFRFTSSNRQAAFKSSTLNTPDRILDFNKREGDRFQLDFDNNLNTIDLPRSLFYAGKFAGSQIQAANRAFADSNSNREGKQPLGVGQAVFFKQGQQTFLAVNDGDRRFSASRDLLLSVSGIQFSSKDLKTGILPVKDYFV